MIVVHVIIGLNVGGAELMLKRLIESTKQEDVIHKVVSLTSLGVIGSSLKDNGITVISLGLNSVLGLPLVFFRLRKLLNDFRPDIVHTWMYHADLIGGVAAYSLGIKNIIWGVRSTDITKGGSKVTLVIRKLCAFLSSVIPKRILFAAKGSRDVHLGVGYDPLLMQVIPNGYDLSCYTGNKSAGKVLRQSLGIYDNELVFISIGRYSPVKDHATFIRSACLLLEQHNNIKFMMLGRDITIENDVLMSIINAKGFSDKFMMLGERPDVPVCLAASDIFCLHSVTEGFPNVLAEAMASSLVCVATDVGDAAMLLNTPSMVVTPSCPKQLAEVMSKALNKTYSERERIGHINCNRIYESFSMQVVSGQYLKLYQELSN